MVGTTLTSTLTRRDAAEGLVRFTNTVKPFHSKILDVLIDYVYSEDVKVSVADKNELAISVESLSNQCFHVPTSFSSNTITIPGHYANRFQPGARIGVVFGGEGVKTHIVSSSSNSLVVDPSIDPVFTSIEVVSASITSLPTVLSLEYIPTHSLVGTQMNALIIDGHHGSEFLPQEQVIIGRTQSDALDGSVYTISTVTEGVDVNTGRPITTLAVIELVAPQQVRGVLRSRPLVLTQPTQPVGSYPIGTIWLNPLLNSSQRWSGTDWIHNYTLPLQRNIAPHLPYVITSASSINNTLTLDVASLQQTFDIALCSANAGQFILSNNRSITTVNTALKSLTIAGLLTTEEVLVPGSIIYVSTPGEVTQLTVVAVADDSIDTTITVQESIPSSLVGNSVAIPSTKQVPLQSGHRVEISSDGILPLPLSLQEYYFIPISDSRYDGPVFVPGRFALSTTRYPHHQQDFVHVEMVGQGSMSVTISELFVPGTAITITDSYLSKNDGAYTVESSERTASTATVLVNEQVPFTTPVGLLVDGVVRFDVDSALTISPTICSNATTVVASARIRERLTFEFGIALGDMLSSSMVENDSGMSVSASGPGNTMQHSMLPQGYDTQFFDRGGMDETPYTSQQLYGTTIL